MTAKLIVTKHIFFLAVAMTRCVCKKPRALPGSLNTSSTLIKLLARQSNNAQAQVVDGRAAKSELHVMRAITIKAAQDCTQDKTSCINQLSKAAKGWQKICTTEWTGKEAALKV